MNAAYEVLKDEIRAALYYHGPLTIEALYQRLKERGLGSFGIKDIEEAASQMVDDDEIKRDENIKGYKPKGYV